MNIFNPKIQMKNYQFLNNIVIKLTFAIRYSIPCNSLSENYFLIFFSILDKKWLKFNNKLLLRKNEIRFYRQREVTGGRCLKSHISFLFHRSQRVIKMPDFFNFFYQMKGMKQTFNQAFKSKSLSSIVFLLRAKNCFFGKTSDHLDHFS